MAAIAHALLRNPTVPAAPLAQAKTEIRQLWLCAYFPELALESLKLDATQAVAVLDTVKGKPCLQTVSASARQTGIETGMTMAAAQALCPQLVIRMRDSQAERQALRRLAETALDFSPKVSIEYPCFLLLEIRSCLTLFGGAEALREKLRQALQTLQHHVCIAITPSADASILLARLGQETLIQDRQVLRSLLGPLPIAALELGDKTTRRLHNAGIRQLLDLWRLPRDGLARRYGQTLLRRLDALSGAQGSVLPVFKRPLHFYAHREMPVELERIEHFFPAIEHLALEFSAFLQSNDSTALAIGLNLSHRARTSTCLTLDFRRGNRDPEQWLLLLHEKLQRLTLPAPVISIALFSDALTSFRPEPVTLFDTPDQPNNESAWQAVLDQLQARLGHSALLQPGLQDDHRPEQAMQPYAATTALTCDLPPRPLWLLPEPKALDIGSLQLLPETERIESGWWDGLAIRRDYRAALDPRGRKLWIFRDLTANGGWYLHGLFG